MLLRVEIGVSLSLIGPLSLRFEGNVLIIHRRVWHNSIDNAVDFQPNRSKIKYFRTVGAADISPAILFWTNLVRF